MSNQNTKIDCCICYNGILESNFFYKSEIINTCKDCINYFTFMISFYFLYIILII